jgi:hypothetical protein
MYFGLDISIAAVAVLMSTIDDCQRPADVVRFLHPLLNDSRCYWWRRASHGNIRWWRGLKNYLRLRRRWSRLINDCRWRSCCDGLSLKDGSIILILICGRAV